MSYDVAVIGAGFGGLSAALGLAERGARVVLLEALNYPGGCASTFVRDGYRFEAGATLFSGLASDQLFGRMIARHGLDVHVDWLDPLVTLRTPSLELAVTSDRNAFVSELMQRAGPRADRVREFFALQRRVAEALWALFEDPTLLPPFDASALARHAGRLPKYLPLVPLLGRPLGELLTRYALREIPAVYQFIRAVCQITVQCDAEQAEAPFALSAMDYYFRGTGHVRGGIGALAHALVSALRARGGEVHLATRVRSVARTPAGFRLSTRRGEIEARTLVANLLPQDLRSLLAVREGEAPALDRLSMRVAEGWGAVMLYRVVRTPSDAKPGATHLELIQDEGRPLSDGNHVFVSSSSELETARCPNGMRTLTASTHVSVPELRALSEAERARHVQGVQDAMRRTLDALAPTWSEHVVHELTASPRTFARFTSRSEGLVGGIPRIAGLAHYRDLGPFEALPRVYLVGDSVFPGQSTLATALGGERTAERIARLS